MKAAAKQEDFVPFGPASLGAASKVDRGPELKVVPAADAGTTFSPLRPAANGPHGTAAGHGAASFTLQKEGERITGIRVECACGQVIELACQY